MRKRGKGRGRPQGGEERAWGMDAAPTGRKGLERPHAGRE